MPDAQIDRLAAIRRRHSEASTDWQFALTNEGETVAARVIPVEEPYAVLRFSKECSYPDREFVCNAHADNGFLLELLDQSFEMVRRLRRALERRQPKPKDYAAECAMKCAEPAFQQWMHEVHGLDNAHDATRVANRVRTMLAIQSRAQLNIDQGAADRWRKMVDDFEAWNKRRGRR